MIDQIKIVAEPMRDDGYKGAYMVRWQIVVRGEAICVYTIVPMEDLTVHSVFDHIWENAKAKIQREIDSRYGIKTVL